MISGKILGNTYVINGALADVSGFDPDMSADIYYEVVRLMDGKVLFFQDHIDRLQHSLSGSGLQFPGSEEILNSLSLLEQGNDFTVGNIRICIQRTGESASRFLCYFVPYIYPEACMYMSGVQLVTFPHSRPNPGIKKWDDRFRVSVNQYIRDHGVYEALLLNEQQQITEGSRSNVFFLDEDMQIITPPEKDVLPGITRKYVMEICKKNALRVMERPVPKNELSQLVSCFISGTSPKVLPVWQIDGYQFRADHPLLRIIMDEFEAITGEHLTSLK